MSENENLLQVLGNWWAKRQKERSMTDLPHDGNERKWLPSRGNVLFTLVMIGMLLWAQSAGAVPFRAESATSTGTIAYQGRLADSSGNPLTSTLNMSFRLYSAVTGGTPLWTEQWTGSNGVKVSDGLFNVMLGSLTPIPQSVITGNSTLFLGITVGTDDEMAPRVQLGSVPFAVQALSVPDGSITAAKIADGSVTKAKLGSDVTTQFGGQPNSYPYLVHLRHFALAMGNYCYGYVPRDPAIIDNPACISLDGFLAGTKFYAQSGTGYAATANNLPGSDGGARWGYAYTYFLSNPGDPRQITVPMGSCTCIPHISIRVRKDESAGVRYLVKGKFSSQSVSKRESSLTTCNPVAKQKRRAKGWQQS